MKGLLIKEFLGIKRYFKTLSLLLALYVIIAFMTKSISIFGIVVPLVVFICTFNTFTYDSTHHWDAFAISFPLSRVDLVKSKYIFILIMSFSITLIAFILSSIIGLINALPILLILSEIMGSAAASLLLGAVMIPLIYKVGVEKARYTLMVIILIPSLIFLIITGINLPSFSSFEHFFTLLTWSFLVLVGLALLVSYHISKKIFLEKDL